MAVRLHGKVCRELHPLYVRTRLGGIADERRNFEPFHPWVRFPLQFGGGKGLPCAPAAKAARLSATAETSFERLKIFMAKLLQWLMNGGAVP
jgi:hypothetical protein